MIGFFKVLATFALVIFLLRKKVNLGIAMFLASLTLGLLFMMPVKDILITMYQATISPSTYNLVIALILIMFMENIMRHTLMMQKMVQSLRGLIPDPRIVMALLPAFIGFLPSAGGARFSAPLVDEVTQDEAYTPERKSFINFWYRHIWEYIFPLYPTIILASEIFHVSFRSLAITQFPFTILAILLGIPGAFMGCPVTKNGVSENGKKQDLQDLLIGLSPIIFSMFLVFALKINISVALGFVVVALLLVHRYSYRQTKEMIIEAFSFSIVLLVVGVLIFKDMLVASRALDSMLDFFTLMGIPDIIIVIVLPFLVSFFTGYAQGFAAVGFPVILGLMPAGGVDMQMIALGFVSGMAGVMLSPLHLCLLLTVEHFKANFAAVYRQLVIPQLLLILSGVVLYYLF